MPPYPRWRYFPAFAAPPDWVDPLVSIFTASRGEIDSAVTHEKRMESNDVLRALAQRRPPGPQPRALPGRQQKGMTTFHKVFTAAAVALAVAGVAQAAPSSSSATAFVKATAYVKGGPVGVTVRGDPVAVGEMCKGLFATKGFTRCRAGGSRYQATACAWRITPTSGGTSIILTVTTARAMLAAIRPRVCPALARYVRGYPGIRAVRLR